jgi:crossover junction endodeoxyribonuclease RuvC
MIILGVDPGLTIAGFCLLETNGKKINLHAYGTIKSDTKDSMPNRLKYLFEEVDKIIKNLNQMFWLLKMLSLVKM